MLTELLLVILFNTQKLVLGNMISPIKIVMNTYSTITTSIVLRDFYFTRTQKTTNI